MKNKENTYKDPGNELVFHRLVGNFALSYLRNQLSDIGVQEAVVTDNQLQYIWDLLETNKSNRSIIGLLLETPNILVTPTAVAKRIGKPYTIGAFEQVIRRIKKQLEEQEENQFLRGMNGFCFWNPELPVLPHQIPNANFITFGENTFALTPDGQLFCFTTENFYLFDKEVFQIANGWFSFITIEQTNTLMQLFKAYPKPVSWEALVANIYPDVKYIMEEDTFEKDKRAIDKRIFRMKPLLPSILKITNVHDYGFKVEIDVTK